MSVLLEEYIPRMPQRMFSNVQSSQQHEVQVQQPMNSNTESGDEISKLSNTDFEEQQSDAEDFRNSSSTSDGKKSNSLFVLLNFLK